MEFGPLLQALIGLVALGITWLTKSLAGKAAADASKSRTERALYQVGELVLMLAGKAWDRLSPKIQAALQDGTVTAEERGQIEDEVQLLLAELTDAGTLEQLAKALGLPMAGLVARIAAGIIDMVTRAHDPDLPETASPLAFPVGSSLATDPAPAGSYGG